jgi:serine/threonine-protein kinase
MGRTNDALRQHEKALEIDPNSGFAQWSLGNVYLHMRKYDEAIAQYKKAIPLSGTSPDETATLAYAYAKSGRKQQAMLVVEELKRRSQRHYVPASLFAATYAALGDHHEAARWLEKALEDRDGILVFVGVDPIFEDIRSDSRYEKILSRVGLPK